jgi:hypothetical protein
MLNRCVSRFANKTAVFALFSLFGACSKEKQEDPSAAASAQPATAVSQAAAPAAAPSLSHSPPAAVVDRQTANAVEQSCKGICEHSKTLKCAHAEECMKNCIGMGVGTPCSEQFSALYACFLREPIAHWECSEDGIAAIREGYCEKEQERAVGCMEAKAQP